MTAKGRRRSGRDSPLGVLGRFADLPSDGFPYAAFVRAHNHGANIRLPGEVAALVEISGALQGDPARRGRTYPAAPVAGRIRRGGVF